MKYECRWLRADGARTHQQRDANVVVCSRAAFRLATRLDAIRACILNLTSHFCPLWWLWLVGLDLRSEGGSLEI